MRALDGGDDLRARSVTSADGVRVMRALAHPLRCSIFDLVSCADSPVTSRQIRQNLDERVSLGLVAFHVGHLEAAGLLVATGVQRRGRGREQFFALSDRGKAVKPVIGALATAAATP